MPPRSAAIMALFTPQNYQFSTQAPGRKSTMYFRDGMRNLGRIKRMASSGGRAGLYYSGRGDRLFINYMETLRLTQGDLDLPNDDSRVYDIPEHLASVLQKLKTGRPIGRAMVYSLMPQQGWRLFEFFNGRCHGSSGTVILQDPDVTKTKIDAILVDLEAYPQL